MNIEICGAGKATERIYNQIVKLFETHHLAHEIVITVPLHATEVRTIKGDLMPHLRLYTNMIGDGWITDQLKTLGYGIEVIKLHRFFSPSLRAQNHASL